MGLLLVVCSAKENKFGVPQHQLSPAQTRQTHSCCVIEHAAWTLPVTRRFVGEQKVMVAAQTRSRQTLMLH